MKGPSEFQDSALHLAFWGPPRTSQAIQGQVLELPGGLRLDPGVPGWSQDLAREMYGIPFVSMSLRPPPPDSQVPPALILLLENAVPLGTDHKPVPPHATKHLKNAGFAVDLPVTS